MSLKKFRDTVVGALGASTMRSQPSYHTEIDEAYLEALQRQVDAEKPKDFRLTPIGAPGW